LKRILAAWGMAGLLATAPAFVPLPQYKPVKVADIGLCGTLAERAIDSANAAALPCPVQVQPHPTPWVAIIMGASVASVMINAAIVHQTQCRELTFQEAYASISLPVIGWFFNQQNNQCGRHGHRH
jgi:hypothetical protein